MTTQKITIIWRSLSLPRQFLLAGTVVMATAMFLVGNWVSGRIKLAVVEGHGASAAVYVESLISPLGQELAQSDTLSPPAQRALVELFEETAIGDRIVSYKIWKPDGRIAFASDESIVGRSFEVTDDLEMALAGNIASSYENLDELENLAEAALGIPLLEVYTPVRENWTGKVIAVAEFYERAEDLESDLVSAIRYSWMVVAVTFFASGGMLYGIVLAGGRLIETQRAQLQEQLKETQIISEQNIALRQRVVSASSRAIAQAERTIRRVGSDLHDGPAQYLALASLRLDSALPESDEEDKDAEQVKNALKQALVEIRTISRGLALPDLDDMVDIRKLATRAVSEFGNLSDLETKVVFNCDQSVAPLTYAVKLCIYRFLQEILANASRHAQATMAEVTVTCSMGSLSVLVKDDGQGFDPEKALRLRSDGGQGLLGMIDRAESIGGNLSVNSTIKTGSEIILTLPLGDT